MGRLFFETNESMSERLFDAVSVLPNLKSEKRLLFADKNTSKLFRHIPLKLFSISVMILVYFIYKQRYVTADEDYNNQDETDSVI